jgi:hypothetical protein
MPITIGEFAMFSKRLGIGVLLAMAQGVCVHGATVSCIVIETGIREEIPTIDSSRLWEYALLDVFFDTGHIVSNAPILRVAEKPRKDLPDEARASLNEALEGGVEFFVVAVLDYQNPAQGGTDRLQLRNVSLRIFKTAPYRLLYSREYAPYDIHNNGKDEASNAMNAVRAIANHLRD